MAPNPPRARHFQHSPLKHPRQEIRLCKFIPQCCKDRTHVIELEIDHYSLDNVAAHDYLDDDGVIFANFDKDDQVASFLYDNGQRHRVRYTAISYCWGGNTGIHIITLNRQIFEVSDNLYRLLTILRDSGDDQRLLWIDQLCINQLDLNERNMQVSLMGFIYSSAEAVYAWLGEATATTNSGLAMLELLETCGTSSERMEKGQFISCTEDVLAKEELDGLVAVRDLLTREYWTRLWIVQEAVYARQLFFLCGRYKYQFGRYKKKLDFSLWSRKITLALKDNDAGGPMLNIEESGDTVFLDPSYILPRTFELLEDYLFMLECREQGKGPGYIVSFDTVAAHAWRQCRDPRDRIFGLQTLVAPSHRVRVDYGKSTQEIFYEWVSESDTRQSHFPLDSSKVQTKIRSLHLAMGLGDISDQELEELVEDPQRQLKHIRQRVEGVPDPGKAGNLSLRRSCFKINKWHMFSSAVVVIFAYGLVSKRLYSFTIS
ncbi:heterokaryon incompatibility protein-domain-containing protein [Xylariales sp. PMI_506]|nr:heterokaryon incompatibility protein-domain-containing protein [Xylariales sp. PMI_506]